MATIDVQPFAAHLMAPQLTCSAAVCNTRGGLREQVASSLPVSMRSGHAMRVLYIFVDSKCNRLTRRVTRAGCQQNVSQQDAVIMIHMV
jgi:hypothetical protein